MTHNFRPDIPVREVVETKLGTRGMVLLVIGGLLISWGISVWSEYLWDDPDRAVPYQGLPIEVRVSMWVATGVASIIAGLGPKRWQRKGFAAAVIMPTERAVSHMWSWFMWVIPGGPPGDGFGWATSIHWALLVLLFWIASQWDEDIPLREKKRGHRADL